MRRKPWEGLRQTDQRSARRAADWNVRRQIEHGLSPLDPTLSSKTHIAISSGAQAVDRVALRVKLGGHHVPENDVLRRFDRAKLLRVNVRESEADDDRLADRVVSIPAGARAALLAIDAAL